MDRRNCGVRCRECGSHACCIDGLVGINSSYDSLVSSDRFGSISSLNFGKIDFLSLISLNLGLSLVGSIGGSVGGCQGLVGSVGGSIGGCQGLVIGGDCGEYALLLSLVLFGTFRRGWLRLFNFFDG